MITTVTLNAAMDRALVVPNFLVGRRHRATESVTLPGGHGVTIARALRRLGTPVVATGFVGGLTGGNILERLTEEGILNDFVRISEPSRTSTAVIDPVTGVFTEINEHGPSTHPTELALLLEKLRYLVSASKAVVVAGSLPRGVEDDTYQRILRAAKVDGMLTVLTQPEDSNVLRAGLAAEPGLTVVDQREAEGLVGHEFSGEEDFLGALDEMARMGGQGIIVMHETGCYARLKAGRAVSYHTASHDPVEPVSPLGTTDVFIAGYLNALLADRPATERLTYGLAAALANLRMLGAGMFEKGDAVRLQRDVQTRDLEPVRQQELAD